MNNGGSSPDSATAVNTLLRVANNPDLLHVVTPGDASVGTATSGGSPTNSVPPPIDQKKLMEQLEQDQSDFLLQLDGTPDDINDVGLATGDSGVPLTVVGNNEGSAFGAGSDGSLDSDPFVGAFYGDGD